MTTAELVMIAVTNASVWSVGMLVAPTERGTRICLMFAVAWIVFALLREVAR